MKLAPEGDWMLGEDFTKRAKHHESIKALWETKWKFPCSIGVYPFHDGKLEDFEPVFQYLIENNINDAYTDAYTTAFFPTCDALLAKAESETLAKNHAEASSLYFRIAALYRISRFPIMNSPIKYQAWEAQKAAYLKATANWVDPLTEELIPHTFRTEEEGEHIPVYVRVPVTASAAKPVPTMLLITGLDGYRPDNTQRSYEFVSRGWGVVIVEIPGTADSPADAKDPSSPDRLWDSVFKWMRERKIFDMKSVVSWGLSCGGYYAVRIAHTHAKQLKGSVAQGAGVHHFFGEGWLRKADDHEYPFDLSPALAQKYGYSSPEELFKGAQEKFSLLSTGIVQKPSCRLLLINGTHDGLMPIEDSLLLMNHGSPKEARFFPNLLHMGYPVSNNSIYPWLEGVMASC
ncbi:MAG: hypothetical protein HETSPECPRED_004991 [Heterodermia speciosa]|uniref:Uncharacterized protein n=1 Tax=Heterodermia speciosa TaxID=116794 RepID=A0A8H3FJP6_9LECA|nr:MAG: hypothetical protein HETSPECPRED_004991 [Heterodermia speciosa]